MGRLSKRRNAAAHPDGGLRLAVRALALQGQLEQVVEVKAYFDKLKPSCVDAGVSYVEQEEKEVEHKTAKKQHESQALTLNSDDLECTQKELEAAVAGFEKLKPTCVDAGVSYEEQEEKEVEHKTAKK